MVGFFFVCEHLNALIQRENQVRTNFALRKTTSRNVCLGGVDSEGAYKVEYAVFGICFGRSHSALLGNSK